MPADMAVLNEDSTLIPSLRAGDESLFAMVVDSWSPGMLRVARRHVKTQQSAEDVVQETWLAVVQGLGRFEGRSTLHTWVYGILTNVAKSRGVRESRTTPVPSANMSDAEPSADRRRWEPSPESAAIAGETRRLIWASIARLPEPQRTVMALRDVDGLSAGETCALLDLTPANQRVLLHRARAKVRQALEDYLEGALNPR